MLQQATYIVTPEPQAMKFFPPKLTARIHPIIYSTAYKGRPFESEGLDYNT